jgi:hypothetical protein
MALTRVTWHTWSLQANGAIEAGDPLRCDPVLTAVLAILGAIGRAATAVGLDYVDVTDAFDRAGGLSL